MMRKLLLLALLLLPISAYSQQTVWVPFCSGTNDTLAFTNIIAAIGANTASIRLPYKNGTRCAVNNLTIPANITLDNVDGTGIKVNTGQTLTINGTIKGSAVQLFYNALAAQGTVSIISRATQDVYPEWWGASPAASAATNTPALQAAIIGAYGNTRTNPSGLWVSNRTLRFSGMYQINDELKVYHMIGFRWEGQTKFNSGITQTGVDKRIIDGQSVAYGVFNQLRFQTTVAQGNNKALLDINYDGSQGSDLRPQNITFNECVFEGGGLAKLGVWLSKTNGSQGDNIRFENCYINGFTFAGAILGGNGAVPEISTGQYSFNAINVRYIGGDIQSCPNYGLASYAGNWIVEGTTVENQTNDGSGIPTQTGADFYFEAPQTQPVLRNIRSESVRVLQGPADIENVSNTYGGFIFAWESLSTPIAGSGSFLNQTVQGTHVGGDGKLYKVTVPGVWGGANNQTATSGSLTTIVKTAAGWGVNAFTGYRASILSGTGQYQYCIITSNTADTITCSAGWVTDYPLKRLSPGTIVAAAAGSVFEVEPNWGTQFTSGTTTFALFEYNVIDGNPSLGPTSEHNGVIRNFRVTQGGGKVHSTSRDIRNMTVTRSDWATGSNNDFDDRSTSINYQNILVFRNVVAASIKLAVPWTFPRNGGVVKLMGPDISPTLYGTQWHMWQAGMFGGGVDYPDVGIGRGDGAYDQTIGGTVLYQNVLAFRGRLGRETATGTDVAGTDTDIQGGLSTGSGTPGGINFYVGVPSTTSLIPNIGTLAAGVGKNRLSWHFKGADVVSAAAIVPTGNLFHVTGTTTITSITSTGITAGTRITIIFDGILTFTDGSNLVLATNFVTTANDTITLVFDGTNWYETGRSVN